ncbi:hypothetical protein FJZ31_17965 [Candidatus Poribacteria bacterium]|nr:hypothetical protein [Candidatus Poribacteria bacterium]
MQMCPKCNHDNPAAAKFCNMCGTELIGLLGKGEILHSRYRVTKVLGYGGFGAVYLAEDTKQNNAFCAVKSMFDNPNWTFTERARNIQSFQEEASLLRSLSHQNLPKVTDVFADGGKQYFVMEFVTGQNLKDIIDKGGIIESQVIGWMIQICDALEYLHSNNIIHRDIKPANIRFTPEGQIKLVDFGIAKRFDPSNPKTDTIKRAATPGYAPLEQYGTGGHTDARSDIYALGATLYHLLTAQRPPDANDRVVQPTIFIPPRKSNPNISANCEQVILKAMAIRPEDRFQKASEMKDTLLGRTYPTFPCPKCQTSNPVGAPVCLACQTPFTGTMMNPFRFRSGKQATTLQELVTLIDGNWTDGVYHLYAGDIANWLGIIGRADLATNAQDIIANEKNENIGLEKFLRNLGTRNIIRQKDGMKMRLIPAGEFQMGSNDYGDEKPVHTVYLDAYYIDETEVTNEQYCIFLNNYGNIVDTAGHRLLNVSWDDCLIEKVGNTYKPKSGYEKHPVVEVSWYGAAAYAQWVEARLPTEAEWEKAARGGLVGKCYPWGNEIFSTKANYNNSSRGYSGADMLKYLKPVGSFAPNGYGLYDMAGNVWEWCADEYGYGYYSRSPRDNPKGPGTTITFRNNDFTNVKSERVLRGGRWNYNLTSDGLRCAARGNNEPTAMVKHDGFRCAQDP